MRRDFIGDIHGHREALEDLLAHLGYHKDADGWAHPDPERELRFVGDYCDRGPDQVGTISLVRDMVDRGTARAIMGNHEFNAIAWATPDLTRDGAYLRPHTAEKRHQHQAFLDQVGEGSARHDEIIDWFRTLPVWLDEGDTRMVHACWHEPSMRALSSCLDDRQRFTPDGFIAAATRGTAAFDQAEIVLKGQEVDLPDGVGYHDKDGILRRRTRVRWWKAGPVHWHEAALVDDTHARQLPDAQIDAPELHGYEGTVPLFVGHYWMRGTPAPLHDHVACLDYSVAKGGSLYAYCWRGESVLRPENFVCA